MTLHENKELFQDAVTATSQQKGIPEIYVEKDYWVTLALHTIFNDEIGNDTIFKGGTALSKCSHLIDRFSEDIDLVVLRRDGETNNQLKGKIKKISKCVDFVIPEVVIDGITHKKGIIRKTAHRYDKNFDGDLGRYEIILLLNQPGWETLSHIQQEQFHLTFMKCCKKATNWILLMTMI